MSAIKWGIIAFGIGFYAFSITTLIRVINEENFEKSFFRIIDTNDNGVISKKEVDAFRPCPEYNPSKLNKILSQYGKNVDTNDLIDQVDAKYILALVKDCVGSVGILSNPEALQNIKQSELLEQMLETYDINEDETIQWGEYNVANKILKKDNSNSRSVFKFFDKNQDWKISKKEINKVKLKLLINSIGGGSKKKGGSKGK